MRSAVLALLARRSFIEATANFAASANVVLFYREIIFSTEMDAVEVWRKVLKISPRMINFGTGSSVLEWRLVYESKEVIQALILHTDINTYLSLQVSQIGINKNGSYLIMAGPTRIMQ